MIVFGCRLYQYLYTHVNYLHIYIFFFLHYWNTPLFSFLFSFFIHFFFLFFDTAIQGTKLKQYLIPGYGHNAMKLKERKNQFYQYKSHEQPGTTVFLKMFCAHPTIKYLYCQSYICSLFHGTLFLLFMHMCS